MDELWRRLVVHLVQHWVPGPLLTLLLDDTLINKSGRKVNGAGFFHDAVTSSAVAHKVTAWGLNVVILALRVPSPWGGEPLALPIMICLRHKGDKELSHVELAVTLISQLARWLPDHRFRVVADGAYASLLRYPLPRTVVVTRLRRDAALYDPAPPRTGRRGRPRTKGDRLPTLDLAASATDWTPDQVCFRGQMVERLLWSRKLLWYETARSRPLLLVIVRDPAGHQHDDFFIISDTTMAPAEVASLYSDRWAIEDTNRYLKRVRLLYRDMGRGVESDGRSPESGVAEAGAPPLGRLQKPAPPEAPPCTRYPSRPPRAPTLRIRRPSPPRVLCSRPR